MQGTFIVWPGIFNGEIFFWFLLSAVFVFYTGHGSVFNQLTWAYNTNVSRCLLDHICQMGDWGWAGLTAGPERGRERERRVGGILKPRPYSAQNELVLGKLTQLPQSVVAHWLTSISNLPTRGRHMKSVTKETTPTPTTTHTPCRVHETREVNAKCMSRVNTA